MYVPIALTLLLDCPDASLGWGSGLAAALQGSREAGSSGGEKDAGPHGDEGGVTAMGEEELLNYVIIYNSTSCSSWLPPSSSSSQ